MMCPSSPTDALACSSTYIVISMWEHFVRIVPHLQALIITDEGIPVVTEVEFTIQTTYIAY